MQTEELPAAFNVIVVALALLSISSTHKRGGGNGRIKI